MESDLLVILNDNEMSISRNVGAMSNYLAKILSSKTYTSMREGTKVVLNNIPPIKEMAKRWEEHTKGMVTPGTLFEELGFYYIGPVDGHNVKLLTTTLQNMKAIKGPKFLHIVTQKGKGYKPAEGAPIGYHAVAPFDVESGEQTVSSIKKRTFTNVFSDWICDMAEQDEQLLAITPAMREGSGLVEFSKKFPERYYDVGIAEQHALTFAAGIACEGLKPVVAIYSTFLQRAYDQLIHDISIQDLDVMLAIDRAGLVGADGATHAGIFDISFMRCIPNIVIFTPSDEAECRDMLYTAYQHKGLTAVRYPRGAGVGAIELTSMQLIEIGKGTIKRKGTKIAILNFGTLISNAEAAAEALDATLADMRFAKPIDEELITQLSQSHDLIVTLEENVIAGGAGSAVNEYLASDHKPKYKILNIGLPDTYLHHGTQDSLREQSGLDAASIIQKCKNAL